MSLASRIANIFTPSQAPQHAATDGYDSIALVGGEGYKQDEGYRFSKGKESINNLAMEEEEEEARPPYLHV